ncbi:DNA-binding domain-containing protein [Alisedimentitalea sp. MJ-SS2]|uniref:HvfC/BufC N-terminal domain-containing protein n=1 Tax=Aliisedimentitalea sp. MJ-SS2 TaxID=3049795 RepID=UPI0029123D80|nr:DNA-binding domain-containing protein [Alisedimentitalea sp. MJ-SS2]MDU8926349.1 DNA-binding domain-containing protein [Alisedimentitalea sp. MJ-SS2]
MTASRQTQFHDAILDPTQPAPPNLLDGRGAPAGRRFSVYRNNVFVSLIEALEQTFPVIRKLIGTENFTGLAGHYYRAHPPTSPILSNYGADFPAFLEKFEPLAHLGYLPDTARLERALVDSYNSADHAPLDPGVFSTTPPEDLPRLSLALAPAIRLIRSPWPIHGIWLFNTEDDAPQPPHRAQDVLITRPEYDPQPRLLPEGGAAFVTHIAKGDPLGAAVEAASVEAAEFDLSTLLSLLLQDNALASAQLKDTA